MRLAVRPKALVTTTSTAAKVEIATAVPTRVVLTARRFSTIGGWSPARPTRQPLRHLPQDRADALPGRPPAEDHVSDQPRRDRCRGTHCFADRNFRNAAGGGERPSGPATISSGLGCSAKCIQKALPVAIGPTAAVFEFGTDTPARIELVVSRDAAGHDVASRFSSGGLVTKWTASATLLDPGTRYFLSIRGTDASGRTNERHWTFETVEQHVQVTLWKIEVISDGDKGRARGELRFEYWAGATRIGDDGGFHKRKSGDVFTVHASGTSRPGLTTTLAANGRDPTFDLRVYADECDGPARMKNCEIEAREPGWIPHGGGDFGGDDFGDGGRGLLARRTPRPRGAAAEFRHVDAGRARRLLRVRDDRAPREVPRLRLSRRLLRLRRSRRRAHLRAPAACNRSASYRVRFSTGRVRNRPPAG